jgi:hypothetical protein
VAAPLGWDELAEVGPTGVTLTTIGGRLESDPWAGAAALDLSAAADAVDADLEKAGIELERFDRFRSG